MRNIFIFRHETALDERRVDADGETSHLDGHGHLHWHVDLEEKDFAMATLTDLLQRFQLITSDGDRCAVVIELDRLFFTNFGTRMGEWKPIEPECAHVEVTDMYRLTASGSST